MHTCCDCKYFFDHDEYTDYFCEHPKAVKFIDGEPFDMTCQEALGSVCRGCILKEVGPSSTASVAQRWRWEEGRPDWVDGRMTLNDWLVRPIKFILGLDKRSKICY